MADTGGTRGATPLRRLVAVAAVAAAIALIGWLDAVTGLVPDVTVLYLLPIIGATYELGLWPGILAALVVSVVEVTTHPGAQLFGLGPVVVDALTHLAVFVLAAVVTSRFIAQLRATQRLEERRDRDLAIARDVHASYLEAPVTARTDVSIGSRLGFALDLGGDYLRVADTRCGLFLTIGDISGKGATAALFTVTLHEQLLEALSTGCDPAGVLASVNRRVYGITPTNVFVTLFGAAIDDEAVTFVNAGHEPPLLLLPDAAEPTELTSPAAIPLGIEEDAPAAATRMPFPPGSLLLCVTDGVTESPRLGTDARQRVARLLVELRDRPPQAVANAVFDAAVPGPGEVQRDDITVLCIRREAAVR